MKSKQMNSTQAKQNPLSLSKKTNSIIDLIDSEGNKQYELFKYKVGDATHISVLPKGKPLPAPSKSGYYDTLVFAHKLVVRVANVWGEGDRNEDENAKYKKKIGDNRDKVVIYEGITDGDILEFFEEQDYNEYLKKIMDNSEILENDIKDAMCEGNEAVIKQIAIDNSKKTEEEFDELDGKTKEIYLEAAKNTFTDFSVIKIPNKKEKLKKNEPLIRTFSIVSYRYKNLNVKKENKRILEELYDYVQDGVSKNRIKAEDSRFYFLNKRSPKIYNLVNVKYVDPKNPSSKKLLPVKVGGKNSDYYDYFSEDNLINWFSSSKNKNERGNNDNSGSSNNNNNNNNNGNESNHCRDPLNFPYYPRSPIQSNDIVYVRFKPWISHREGGKISFQFRLDGDIQLLARLKSEKSSDENIHADSFSEKMKEKLKNCDYFGSDVNEQDENGNDQYDNDQNEDSKKRIRDYGDQDQDQDGDSQHSETSLEEREANRKKKYKRNFGDEGDDNN